jgi:hypothetical protein
MKRLVWGMAFALAATAAAAQSRPSTTAQPCATSQRMVAASGAIVLGTGGYTYDRFVRDGGFCEFDETTEPAWVPSRDTPSCFIGYRCKSRSHFFDD